MENLANVYWINDKSPSIAGILSGGCKGAYWFNKEVDPTIGVAYSYCVGGCGIMGETSAIGEGELKEFLEQKVFPGLRQRGIFEFEFSVEDDQLRKLVLHIFQDKNIQCEEEYSYRSKAKNEKHIVLPAAYTLKEVDSEFLDRISHGEINNSSMLIDRLKNSWSSQEKFLLNSVAYVVMERNEIVGVIFGSSRYKKYVTIDIEVEELHRNRGLATGLTTAFINRCIEKSYVPQWDHVASNKESKVVANKCGFELFKVRPYHWFNI